jgi:hypothetical protein
MNSPNHLEQTHIQEVLQALKFIPAGDRETWLKVLMCLKDGIGNDAYWIAEEWSKTADNYDAKSFVNATPNPQLFAA